MSSMDTMSHGMSITGSPKNSQAADFPAPAMATKLETPSGVPRRSMNELSVLADRFIPAELRAVNTWPITAPIKAGRLPTLDAEAKALSSQLFPSAPCVCGGTNGARHCADGAAVPVRKVEREIRYALHASGAPPPFRPAEQLRRVDEISDRKDYSETFEALLSDERKRILHAYEHYSQYNIPISVVPPLPGTDPPPRFLSARIAIPGISDARPSLQPGDIVLLRPLCPLTLPVYRASMPPQYKWSEPISQSVEIEADVIQVLRGSDSRSDEIHITWVNPATEAILQSVYPPQRFNVRFVPSVTTHERCLTALDWASTCLPPVMFQEFLFPNVAPSLPVHNTRFKRETELNANQAAFVRMVLTRAANPSATKVRPPVILTGPAGTGKTKALLAAILEVLELTFTPAAAERHSRILVCTPSHTAADVVTQHLLQHLSKTELFRLYDSSRSVATVPASIMPYTQQSNVTGAFGLPSATKMLSYRVVVCTCSDAHILYEAGVTNTNLRARRRCFRKYAEHALAECSLTLSGSITGADDPHFTHLFIDEAAQSTEPEFLIPLSVVLDPRPGSVKAEIALFGDPRQLSPNVLSTEASDAGLGRSVVERLLLRPVNCLGGGHADLLGPPSADSWKTLDELVRYSFQKDGHEQLSVFLTLNYRSHPSFLMMPSSLFYADKLRSAKAALPMTTSVWAGRSWIERVRSLEALSEPVTAALQHTVAGSSWDVADALWPVKQKSWPLHFRGVIGKDVSVTVGSIAGANSWSNQAEAEVVVQIVINLLSKGDVSSASIGVMSPFRAQVVLIRKLLRAEGLGGVNVGTIEDYQAVERDVIVLSLTRSNEKFLANDVKHRMGLFGQPKRCNVALTRAEHLFVVVGNPKIMSQDPIWRQWLWFCIRNGLCYGDIGGQSGLELVMESLSKGSVRVVTHCPSGMRGVLMPPRPLEGTADEQDIVTVGTLELMCRRRQL